MGQVQDRIADQNHQLLMLAPEHSGQRLILSFHNDPLSGPLPELGLSSPELLPVPTDHQCGLSFPPFLLILVFAHNVLTDRAVCESTLPRLRDRTSCIRSRTLPNGEASLARQHQIFKS